MPAKKLRDAQLFSKTYEITSPRNIIKLALKYIPVLCYKKHMSANNNQQQGQ